MGRFALYAGASTALAAAVVASAFNQRANFYSACVYLQQSNFCLMVLINLSLLVYGCFMYALQRLCYGPLRSIEIEQLYEKGWFAVTETCLAMTIFREEVGPWFLVMFVSLITGKIWGWIGDGRVEFLEQQPPANPRLFHLRLSVSLAVSVLYDIWMMFYIINTVIQQARPNMMVMFLFEFTILTTSSLSTTFRYIIALVEAKVVRAQTKERILELRREIRQERLEITRSREEAAQRGEPEDNRRLPSVDDIDEADIDVQGWEAKGHWILTLDLMTDFVKLGIYVTFFFILLLFYGIPLHIMRDLFMTTRSFIKRLTAFLRYRRATQDMNRRYEDATVEDLEREDTCIVCREVMRPWSLTNPQTPPAAPGAPRPARPARATTSNQRTRPKKLPCGHILHLGCLKSWLERQQVCPTCRRPLVANAQAARPAANNANRAPQGAQPPNGGQADGAGGAPAAGGQGGGRDGMRVLNLGLFRIGFAPANIGDLARGAGGPQADQNNARRAFGLQLAFPRRQEPQPQAQTAANPTTFSDQLRMIEHNMSLEIRSLQMSHQELQLVQILQAELLRLRALRHGRNRHAQAPSAQAGTAPPTPSYVPAQRFGIRQGIQSIPSNSPDLPPGVVLPEGWSLLPLQGVDQGIFGFTRNPTPTINPYNQPQASPTRPPNPHTPAAPGPSSMMANQPNPHTPAAPGPSSMMANQPNPHTPAAPGPSSMMANQTNPAASASSETVRPNTVSTALTAETARPSTIPTAPTTPETARPSTIPTTSTTSEPVRSMAIPTAAASAAPAASNPPAFPVWGSSQLFLRSNQMTSTAAEPRSQEPAAQTSGRPDEPPADAGPASQEPPAPASGQPDQTPADAGRLSSVSTRNPAAAEQSDAGQSSSLEAQNPGEGSEQRRRSGGSERTATVEDAVDDAEGN